MEFIRKQGNTHLIEKNKGDLVYLQFSNLQKLDCITHLFSTRMGGVSTGDLSSMNLSYTRGDLKENVDENFRRIAHVMNADVSDFVLSDQTHTTNVRIVTNADRGKGICKEKDYTDVDGLITNEPGIVLSTFYADCVPLYFVDPNKKVIGLSHSGWRGTVGRMGAATIDAMERAFQCDRSKILTAIGPSICGDCYEVSEDVAVEFANEFKDVYESGMLRKKENGKYLLDLWIANRQVLTEAGILTENIEITDLCTCCNKELLFSHRATGGKRGNLGAFLKLNDES